MKKVGRNIAIAVLLFLAISGLISLYSTPVQRAEKISLVN
jgi:hypothetical protein